MFLNNITFNSDVTFESTREDHKKKFKVKTKRYTTDNRRKPIYDKNARFGRQIGYEKMKVVEKSFIIFNKELSIDFKPLTIIVGDNGCGKSSLLKYFKPPKLEVGLNFSNKSDDEIIKERIAKWVSNKEYSLKFKANPQYFVIEQNVHKNSFINDYKKNHTDNSGYMKPQNIINMWDMQTDSNGESTIDFLNSLKDIKDSFIVLDEPETSLSIKTQLKMRKLLNTISKNNQLIIVTHSPIFMELSNEVYDFELKSWVNTKNYLYNQYNG
jgi:predicted ATPase